MTEHEFEVFYSNLQSISYAVMIAVLIFVPLIIGAVLKSKKGGATRTQIIIICISTCVLSIGLPILLGYLYTYGETGVKPTSVIYTAVIGWANPLYAVPASAVIYFILRRLVMFDFETDEYKLQALHDAEEKLREENQDNFDAYPWYRVGKDLPEGDVTVIKTAEPSFINVISSKGSYRITVMSKKESLVVRTAELYRPFNCFFKGITPPKYEPPETSGKIPEQYILPTDRKETAEETKTEASDAVQNDVQSPSSDITTSDNAKKRMEI